MAELRAKLPILSTISSPDDYTKFWEISGQNQKLMLFHEILTLLYNETFLAESLPDYKKIEKLLKKKE